jgi:hypothetical protein
MLLGIKDGSGLGNNADEIKTASLLMDNTVIRPFQELLIDSFDQILAYNDISLNLYFTTLQPLEFTEVDTDLQDQETIEEETGVEMSVNLKKIDGFNAYKTIEEAEAKAKEQGCEGYHEHEEDGVVYYMPCKSHDQVNLEEFGEEEDLSQWTLIDERKVDYDDEEALDYQIDELNKKNKSTLSKIWEFVSTGTSRPNAKSKQDKAVKDVAFKVRYQYAPLKESLQPDDSRDFCQKMVKAKKIYRKEDIELMGNRQVNSSYTNKDGRTIGWGPKGALTYSIWKYKGGGACHHFWMRKTYMFTLDSKRIDVKSPLAPTISVNEAKRKGFKPEVNDKLVAKRPIDMPNEGFLPTNKRR